MHSQLFLHLPRDFASLESPILSFLAPPAAGKAESYRRRIERKVGVGLQRYKAVSCLRQVPNARPDRQSKLTAVRQQAHPVVRAAVQAIEFAFFNPFPYPREDKKQNNQRDDEDGCGRGNFSNSLCLNMFKEIGRDVLISEIGNCRGASNSRRRERL